MLCFRKIPVAKKFLDKREGEISRFPLKLFVSMCQKLPKGNFSVFHLFRVSKKKDERVEGECQDLPSKFSCLPVPENFVG